VDLDVDKLSEGVNCLCQSKGRRNDENHKAQQKQIRQDHTAQSLWTQGEVTEKVRTPPMQTNNNRPFVSRSQTHSTLGVPTNSKSTILPIYQSHRAAYSTQVPVWDQSTAILNSGQNLYFTGSVFPSQAQSFKPKYGESEINLPNSDMSAWPFQPDAGFGRVRSMREDSTQPPVTHELSQGDIGAYMGNNQSEEPFL
jgi:hypothetical protein